VVGVRGEAPDPGRGAGCARSGVGRRGVGVRFAHAARILAPAPRCRTAAVGCQTPSLRVWANRRPIGDALGGGEAALQWIVNAYTIAFAAFILSAGALGDRVGARRVFVAGFALFTAASAACGLAPGLGVLVAARAVQGLGAAILVPCSLILLSHAFPAPADRSRAVGLWAAGASVALSGGPLVGGALIAALGWRAIFFINVPIGILGIWLTLRFARETPRAPDRGVDVPGQSAAVLALATLAAATIAGGQGGWGRPGVIAGYAVVAVAFAAFLTWEARSARPMLPLGLFRDRTFSSAAAIGLLLNIAFYGLIFVLSLFFQRDQGRSALATGLAFAPMTGVVMATNVAAGRLARVAGPRRVILLGAVLAAAACALLLGVGRSTPYWAMALPLTMLGGAVGLIVPLMTSELLGSVDRSQSGIASGTLNTMRQTGSVIGVALFGSVVASSVSGIAPGVHEVLGISIALLLATGGLALRMAGRSA